MEQETTQNASEEKLTKNDILKGKHIERNFEKIFKILKERKGTEPKDYVIIALLCVIILMLLFSSPGGSAQLGKKIDDLSQRVSRIEKSAFTPGLDQGVGVGGEEVAREQTPAETAAKTNPKPVKAEQFIKGQVKEYTIQYGDTLSSIVWRVYQTRDPEALSAFGNYNSLQEPYTDLYPGSKLKVPLLKELMSWHQAQTKQKSR